MHFLKKLSYFGLLSFGIVLPVYQSDTHQHIATALHVAGHALENELNNSDGADIKTALFCDVESRKQMIMKVAHAFNHDLTEEQRLFVVDFLQKCKALSAFTTDDFMAMADVALTPEHREVFNKAVENKCPEMYENKQKDLDKLEKVDLEDASFNLLKSFMCRCSSIDKSINILGSVNKILSDPY